MYVVVVEDEHGIRCKTCFRSLQEFQEIKSQIQGKVIAAGVTNEFATLLCRLANPKKVARHIHEQIMVHPEQRDLILENVRRFYFSGGYWYYSFNRELAKLER